MTDLLERDSELAAIETFVRRGGVMLIEAGAGVGKTSLLEAVCVDRAAGETRRDARPRI
jgi:RecA-family ATPase